MPGPINQDRIIKSIGWQNLCGFASLVPVIHADIMNADTGNLSEAQHQYLKALGEFFELERPMTSHDLQTLNQKYTRREQQTLFAPVLRQLLGEWMGDSDLLSHCIIEPVAMSLTKHYFDAIKGPEKVSVDFEKEDGRVMVSVSDKNRAVIREHCYKLAKMLHEKTNNPVNFESAYKELIQTQKAANICAAEIVKIYKQGLQEFSRHSFPMLEDNELFFLFNKFGYSINIYGNVGDGSIGLSQLVAQNGTMTAATETDQQQPAGTNTIQVINRGNHWERITSLLHEIQETPEEKSKQDELSNNTIQNLVENTNNDSKDNAQLDLNFANAWSAVKQEVQYVLMSAQECLDKAINARLDTWLSGDTLCFIPREVRKLFVDKNKEMNQLLDNSPEMSQDDFEAAFEEKTREVQAACVSRPST